jgi:ABC-2 type transport system permease protein
MGSDLWASCRASWWLEWAHLRRSWLFLALALVQGLSFLVLVSLFALTGSRAPTALINSDRSVISQQFVQELKAAHDSFSIRPMTAKQAEAELDAGSIVAIIRIPKGFGASIAHGETALIQVDLDNVDTDMTDDIERAVPSAIVLFGDHYHFPGIRVRSVERDELPHDTGYIEYLVVSALALDVLVVAGVVAGAAVAREWESGTAMAWKTAGSATGFVLGKVGAAAVVGALGIIPPFLLVVLAYRVVPVHWGEAVLTLAGCCLLFACFGAALGALTKRVVPAAALLFGLAIPLYMDSGALEPERFDGNKIWLLAHLSPLYSVVGVLEDVFHGLHVTPEPVAVDALAMGTWTLALFITAGWLAGRRLRA